MTRWGMALAGVAWAPTAFGQSVTVASTGLSYATITEAVSNAAGGDTLTLAAGTYGERVVIDRDLTLDGAGSGSVTIGVAGGCPANCGSA